MGQKVNPIAVRLNLNRLSNYNWFSDYYYSALFYQDINFGEYLNLVKQPNSNKLGFRTGKSVIHRFPKRNFIHLFCLSDERNNEQRLQRETGKNLQMGNHWQAPKARSAFRTFKPAEFSMPIDKFQVKNPWNEFKLKEVSTLLSSSSFLESSENSKNLVSFPSESLLDPNNSINNSIFWFSSSTQQKKRALINLHRGVSNGLTKFYFWPVGEGQQRCEAEVRSADSSVFEEKKKFSPSTGMNKILDHSQVCKNSLNKKLVTNKASWNLKSNSHFVTSDRFPVNSLLSPAQKQFLGIHPKLNPRNSYFNSYAMHYFFLQKTNVSALSAFTSLKSGQENQKIDNNLNSWNQDISKVELYPRVRKQMLRAEGRTGQQIEKNFSFITKSLDFSLSNISHVLSVTSNTSISLRPIKVNSIFYSAFLIAQEVACKLEQKKSFRFICRLIFQQLTLFQSIKGIRITCSGRMNGAEIAKTECRKFGETSLHVFSDKIDYAQAIASTSYGILGVKVWISFL